MKENNQPSYYAIIPSSVRYDTKLSPVAKLLYGEISALTNKEGFCWAENEYFAELYNLHKQTISRLIQQLRHGGYVKITLEYRKGSKQVKRRLLHILDEGINKNVDRYIQKTVFPIHKNVEEKINTTSKNNKINKGSIRKRNLKESLNDRSWAS